MNTHPNLFGDQSLFMEACGQSTGVHNHAQFVLYLNLILEEVEELKSAAFRSDRVEALDALIDILVVTVGALHSMGADGGGAWREVMRSNFAKIDPITGKVVKRDDGKVLKPEGWTPPHLAPYLPPL